MYLCYLIIITKNQLSKTHVTNVFVVTQCMSDHQGGQVDNRLHGHAPSHNHQSKVHMFKARGEFKLLELC